MIGRRLWWLAFLQLAGYARAASQAPPTLGQVLNIALLRNPDLLQARLLVDSAHGERRIAGALPNPTYTGIPGNPYQYSVSLPVDVSLERLYRTRAARRGQDVAELGLEDAIRLVAFNVRQGFYDLLLADAHQQVAREERDILQQLLQADSVRLRAGDISERDLVRSELESARADAALTRADADVRAARLALQALMGVPDPDTGFTVTGQLESAPALTLSVDSLLPLALAERPDLAAARRQAEQSHSLAALATADLLPIPVVSLVYQRAPFASGLRYAFGIALPVPLFYRNGGERERASAGVSAAEVGVRRKRVQVDEDVAVAAANYRSARVLAERYQAGLLDKAEAALEATRFAYQQGAASLLELLDAIRTYGGTRAEFYGAVHDYWVTAFALSRAVGVDVVQE